MHMVSETAVNCIIFTGIGFFSGSVMYSYIIPKMLKNIDVRKAAPDQNPGGMNAIHAAGLPIGLICIFCDIMKAFAPVYFAVTYAGLKEFALIPVVAAPVLGHAFSPFLNFRGGKAVSAIFGALLGLWPVSKIVLLLVISTVFFRFIAVARPDSLCVSISVLCACIASFFFEPLPSMRAAFILALAVVMIKIMKKPNEGRPSISLGHVSFKIENRRLKFHRQ